jgi:hypothetical protein
VLRSLLTILLASAALAAEASSSSPYPLRGSFLTFDRDMGREGWAKELNFMKQVEMETIVILSVGHLETNAADPLGYSPSSDGLLFPSKWAPRSASAEDRLEMILSLADERAMQVYVGSLQTESDWTTGREFTALRAYNRRLAKEIVERYGAHPSLVGWYFPQELWMNWVKYYGSDYYGSFLLRDFVADMKQIDPTKLTAATVVFKKAGDGLMPGLTPRDLESAMAHFLRTTRVDILMPQDGVGAQAGAALIHELPSYFAAMAAARDKAARETLLLAIVETFSARPELSDDRYPPASISRIEQQVAAVGPYVGGSVSWIFGRDMSPQATFYSKQGGALYEEYRARYVNSGALPLPTGN